MTDNEIARGKTSVALTVGILTFLAEVGCYIAKNVLSAFQPVIAAEGSFGYDALGAAGTAFLLCYGAGQLINGALGNRLPAHLLIPAGLIIPAAIMAAIPLVKSALLLAVLWGVCGYFCSMIWGPVTALIGNNTEQKAGRVLMTALSVAALLGHLGAFLLPVLFGRWDLAFYTAGGVTLASGVVFLAVALPLSRKGVVKCRPVSDLSRNPDKKEKRSAAKYFTLGFLMMLLSMAVSGVIRNSLSLWVPTLLVEFFGMETGGAAAVSTAFPFVNVGGTFLSILVLRFFRNEKSLSAVFYAVGGVSLLAALLFPNAPRALLIALLFVGSVAATGVNNIIFSVYIFRYKKFGTISGLSGFFDAFAYAAATLSNLAFTALADGGNFAGMLTISGVLSLVGTLVCVISLFSKRDMV